MGVAGLNPAWITKRHRNLLKETIAMSFLCRLFCGIIGPYIKVGYGHLFCLFVDSVKNTCLWVEIPTFRDESLQEIVFLCNFAGFYARKH